MVERLGELQRETHISVDLIRCADEMFEILSYSYFLVVAVRVRGLRDTFSVR